MRKLKFPVIVLLSAVLAFASCGEKELPNLDSVPKSGLITFEKAELPEEGYLLDKIYKEGGITFDQKYEWFEEYGGYFIWNGFAVSNNDKTVDPSNQFCVYGEGGAGNSDKFAVSYVNGTSEFVFDGKAERIIESVYVANSVNAVVSMMNGDNFAKKFEAEDWFKLTITGYNAQGGKKIAEPVYLADWRDGKTFILKEWQKVELKELGRVNKVVFSLSSSDNGDYGMNTPAYFCIDNISYVTTVSAN